MQHEGEIPKTTIPHQPQVTMQGVTQQFVPTIMKCNMGGFIVVMQGKGISAHSELSGALAFVAAEAYAEMGDTAREDLPDIVNRSFQDRVAGTRNRIANGGLALLFAIVSLAAVKLA